MEKPSRTLGALSAGLGLSVLLGGGALLAAPPSVLVITVDTLRADRLSGYGYARATSPGIDRLMSAGARFLEARTNEPLTAPALATMWTALAPHEHGASRNGLRMSPELPSLGKVLSLRGFRTAAFVGNWTLRDRLLGLGEHFDSYNEVFTRKRWFGLIKAEATASDLNDAALTWLAGHVDREPELPFLIWLHYVEPHAPYRLQEEFRERLGLPAGPELPPSDRYDTEVAFVDQAIGELLDGVESLVPDVDLLTVFTADHGESLGEHDYWGHGRNLHEPGLRVPLSITWHGRIEPGSIAGPALLIDLPRTILGLIELPVPATFGGIDWSSVLTDGADPPRDRVTFYQAHKGAVQPTEVPEKARRRGLIQVARLAGGVKEIYRTGKRQRLEFDLYEDPLELGSRIEPTSDPSSELTAWLELVRQGLDESDALAPAQLDDETIEQLRALGYID